MADEAPPQQEGKRKRRGRKGKKPEVTGASPLRLETADGKPILDLPPVVVAQYRCLHTRLVREEPLPRRLGLMAALREEGVTSVALGLAAVMAHDLEACFCLVELNWWWPGLAAQVQMEPSPGLAEIVAEETTPDEALRPTGMESLWLLPAGATEEAARPHLARSQALKAALETLDGRFDHLLLDIPAVLATGDAVPLAAQADGLCLVIRQGVTPIPLIRQALDEVEHLTIRGVVLNGERTATPRWLLRLIGGGEVR